MVSWDTDVWSPVRLPPATQPSDLRLLWVSWVQPAPLAQACCQPKHPCAHLLGVESVLDWVSTGNPMHGVCPAPSWKPSAHCNVCSQTGKTLGTTLCFENEASLALHPGLLPERQGPKYLNHHLLPSGCASAGSCCKQSQGLNQAFPYEMRVAQAASQLPHQMPTPAPAASFWDVSGSPAYK